MTRWAIGWMGAMCVAATLVPASPARACSCGGKPSVARSLSRGDAVFVGRVVDTRVERDPEHGLPTVVARFEAKRWFNAERDGPIRVRTLAGKLACGIPFEKGQRYLVYAMQEKDGRLSASTCGRTVLLDEAESDLAALEEAARADAKRAGDNTSTPPPEEPSASAAAGSDTDSDGCAIGAAGTRPSPWSMLALGVLFAFARWRWRRRRIPHRTARCSRQRPVVER